MYTTPLSSNTRDEQLRLPWQKKARIAADRVPSTCQGSGRLSIEAETMNSLNSALEAGGSVLELPDGAIPESELIKLVQLLKNNTTVEDVRLGGLTAFTDTVAEAMAKTLRENTCIKRLSLGQNWITDVGVVAIAAALRENKTLEHINLSNNKFGDVGLIQICRALEKNTTIAILAVYGNSVTDIGALAVAELIKKQCHVKRFHLGGNQIGDIGCAAIGAALETNSTVEKVGFVANHISDIGAQALLRALERNIKINEIWLDRNQVSSRMTRRIQLLAKTLPVRENWARGLSLCAATHSRLGATSDIRRMPKDVIRKIMSMILDTKRQLRQTERENFADDDDEESDVEAEEELA